METLQRLDGYSLTRDDLVECLNGAPFQDQKSRFEAIPSKTRASFTRKYNSTIHQQTNIFAKGDDLVSQKQRRGKKQKSNEVQRQEEAQAKKRRSITQSKSKKKVEAEAEEDEMEEEDISGEDEWYYY